MSYAEQFFDQPGIPFAALGVRKIEKLPKREITRMRGHKVEKPGLDFGITEGLETGDSVFWDGHKVKG